MNERAVIVVLVFVALSVIFLNNQHLSITGYAVQDPCAALHDKTGTICQKGASQACTTAREDLRQCVAHQQQTRLEKKPVAKQDCSYKETGKKRCDTSGKDDVSMRILKELKDANNSRCLPRWIADQTCGPGTTCKEGACVGRSCASNSDCVKYNGMACNDGRCVSYCDDIDAGKNAYFIKSTTTSFVGKTRPEEDYCFNQDTLVEWFCDNQYDFNRPGVRFMNYEKASCENGCAEGACRGTKG